MGWGCLCAQIRRRAIQTIEGTLVNTKMEPPRQVLSSSAKGTPGKDTTLPNGRDCEQQGGSNAFSMDGTPTIRSLEVLGSGILAQRKLSAFSIYCPDSPDHCQSEEHEVSIEFLSQPCGRCQSQKQDGPENGQSREQPRAETKNLNRFFRSKMNEMLREIRDSQAASSQDAQKASELLQSLNKSNQIMFKQIREVMVDPWLQGRFVRCRSLLLKYVHKGKMGLQSKLIMFKYFNRILGAIKSPELFRCWK